MLSEDCKDLILFILDGHEAKKLVEYATNRQGFGDNGNSICYWFEEDLPISLIEGQLLATSELGDLEFIFNEQDYLELLHHRLHQMLEFRQAKKLKALRQKSN